MARDSRKGDKGDRDDRSRTSGRLTDPVPIPRGKGPRREEPPGPALRRAERATDKPDKSDKSEKPDKSAKKDRARVEPAKGRKDAAYPPFGVTVDLVVFTIGEGQLQVLLVERREKPFQGRLALPGGFVRIDEDLAEAAYRELVEQTGMDGQVGHLEQLRTFGTPERDPRMRTVSVAYLALAPQLTTPLAGPAGSAARWVPVADLDGVALAFDHARILAHGLERARGKLEYTALATAFCSPEFTVSQLREVYEAVWGRPIDPRNFHRKATRTEGLLEPTGRHTSGEAGRPAQLYRAGPVRTLNPPLTRSDG